MALSNWATLAFNHEGSPTQGIFLKDKIQLRIHKNFLYVDDLNKPKADSLISVIDEGELSICGMKIIAKKGQHHEIFVFASHGYGENVKAFAGIGCYGFMCDLKWLLKNKPEICKDLPADITEKDYHYFYNYDENGEASWGVSFVDNEMMVDIMLPYDAKPTMEDTYQGVTQESYDEFIQWLSSIPEDYDTEIQNFVQRVKASVPKHYNQGDMFFTGDFEEIALPVGQTKQTIFSAILGQ
jgi:hypothetical protein